MDLKMGFAAFLMVLVVFLCQRGCVADDTSCISEIIPCGASLNKTGTPAKACCDGLISVLNTNVACLCGLLKSEIVKQYGINMTQAMELPSRCGKNFTTDQCKSSSGNTSSSSPPTSSPKGDSSSSSSGTKSDSNVASPGAVFSIVPMIVLIMVGVLSHLVVGEFSTYLQEASNPD